MPWEAPSYEQAVTKATNVNILSDCSFVLTQSQSYLTKLSSSHCLLRAIHTLNSPACTSQILFNLTKTHTLPVTYFVDSNSTQTRRLILCYDTARHQVEFCMTLINIWGRSIVKAVKKTRRSQSIYNHPFKLRIMMCVSLCIYVVRDLITRDIFRYAEQGASLAEIRQVLDVPAEAATFTSDDNFATHNTQIQEALAGWRDEFLACIVTKGLLYFCFKVAK
ncbi:hypothetical protein ABKN59_001823 [Abortiporus biennis]